VLIGEGEVRARWMFTSREGDVVKKKSIAMAPVRDRFQRIAQASSPAQDGWAPVAFVHYKTGGTAMLDLAAFDAAVPTFPPSDPTISALQPFVRGKGGPGALFRNDYSIVNDKGKCITGTFKVAPPAAAPSQGVVKLDEEGRAALRSVATSLNAQLDALTYAAVRYVENTQHVRVLKVSVHYIIDASDQIWMFWADDLSVASGAAAADLRYADVPLEGTRARLPAGGQLHPSEVRPRPRSRAAGDDMGRTTDWGAESRVAGLQLGQATGKLEARARGEEDVGPAIPAFRRKGSRQEFSIDAQPPAAQLEKIPKYPTAFSCSGDYCKLQLRDPSGLGSGAKFARSKARQTIAPQSADRARALFTDAEWAMLADKLTLPVTDAAGQVADHHFATITQKSINAARHEKRGVAKQAGIDGIGADDEEGDSGAPKLPRALQDTVSKQQKVNWARQRGELAGGTANHYKQVKVCNNCHLVYSTLDNARNLMEEERQRKLEAERVKARASWAAEVRAQALLQATGDAEAEAIELEAAMMEGGVGSSAFGPGSPSGGMSWVQQSLATTGQDASGTGQQAVPFANMGVAGGLGGGLMADMGGAGAPSETGPQKRPPWRSNAAQTLPSNISEGSLSLQQSFQGLDGYLRGKGAQGLADAKQRAAATLEQVEDEGAQGPTVFSARVLLADNEYDTMREAEKVLLAEKYRVQVCDDGKRALRMATDAEFDVLLLSRELPGANAMEITRQIRNEEANSHPPRRMPIICFTDANSPEDLRLYMEAGMDGCVSKPLDDVALLSTLQAAVPHHQAIPDPDAAHSDSQLTKGAASRPGRGGAQPTRAQQQQNSNMSAALKVTTQAVRDPGDGSLSGEFQLDADTKIPYTILGHAKKGGGAGTFFNFVVVHDMFDTCERMQIFFRPIIARYPGAQVLVWNYPGQAFTEWRRDVLLNNEYLAGCLSALLQHVGDEGTQQFSSSPYYLMGFGNGANIASYYATHAPASLSPVRGLVLVNGFSFVDAHLAGVMHDCMNVFSCSPATRPDLPVYFYTRFLFSAPYLTKTSTPLALNLYTAVHNPITLEGRIQLCLGALSHLEMRSSLQQLQLPLIIVHSSQNGLIKPLHVDALISGVSGQVRSIHKCLKSRKRACVIWMRSGHEVFQECRKPMTNLLEQLVTGYHEVHDVAYMPASDLQLGADAVGGDGTMAAGMEDRFINNILTSMDEVRDVSKVAQNPFGASSTGQDPDAAVEQEQHWEQYRDEMGDDDGPEPHGGGQRRGRRDGDAPSSVLNPHMPAFERQQNVVYKVGVGNRIYPKPQEMPEVREYMSWRLKRNKKQLLRLATAAQCIQRAYRAFMARTLVERMREQKAAMFLQRVYRGARGRRLFAERKNQEWAVRMVQRNWRGHMGRAIFLQRRAEEAGATTIQRIYRARLAKRRVAAIRLARERAATKLQNMYRARNARRVAFARRVERNAATNIERCFRGHQGRRRAAAERDKYLFSKSQTQGIEFGRQMLLEHKLHGTRLQSEVTLLTQEKVKSEEEVEGLLEEISEFEEGVLALEKEMHELSKVETEASGVLDDDARVQLREQKRRLDKEFGVMLAKIADRKERLVGLEDKLQKLDRARQVKEEELRDLERKLVVLLEEQQRELELIRRRQEKKGELLTTAEESGANLSNALVPAGGGGGGALVAHGGPTPQQKRQANALMQSSETLMKFGFMSMSMTYFSSLNMIKALRQVGAHQTLLGAGGGGGEGGGGGGDGMGGGADHTVEPFKPGLKPGMMPGQEPLLVAAWSVDDVGRWLDTLSLPQYRESFADAAVDGAFLYDLNDEDLRNTLGIEHNLHRKKILNAVQRLKRAERQPAAAGPATTEAAPARAAAASAPVPAAVPRIEMGGGGGGGGGGVTEIAIADSSEGQQPAVALRLEELITWVRHGKVKKLKEALAQLPNRAFDPTGVRMPFVEGKSRARAHAVRCLFQRCHLHHHLTQNLAHALFSLFLFFLFLLLLLLLLLPGFGTAYDEAIEREQFHVNKTDDHGNTLLLTAAQNGHLKVAQLLCTKGANPNHQNHQGQTAAHYAMAYNFFDLGAWMLDPEKGGASDEVENENGLGPYDGLSEE
jgi:CheY-like chemotaxis protein/alpha-beta hydrolase superfamily lysophospholipase